MRPTVAHIDLNALDWNLNWIRSHVGVSTWVCPMVKANAYGHGAAVVARRLEQNGIHALGVALPEEGGELRRVGVRVPILVFGSFDFKAVEYCIENHLTPVLSRWYDLKLFAEMAPHKFPVHIKINTGLNRMGFEVEDVQALSRFFRGSQLTLEGVCSHLAEGETLNLKGSTAEQQKELFLNCLKSFPSHVTAHLYNSGALFSLTGPSDLGVRPGISIYGVGHSELKPVMSLKTEIVLVRKVNVGEGVSYNFKWKAKKTSVIGVLPLGYADGWKRILTQKSEALIRGYRVPLIGTICMDYTMVDLTELVDLYHFSFEPGESVVLWGIQNEARISVEEIALQAETISYEVLTTLGARVPRITVEGSQC